MPTTTGHVISAPAAPSSAGLEKAHSILVHACEAATALLKAFDESRKARRASGGNTTNEEQDLLRAMLVFAGAGLDASVKRLIQDSLLLLAGRDAQVQSALQSFAARRLRDEAATSGDTAKGYTLLAAALASDSPRNALVAAYIGSLIGDSLQSSERLAAAIEALGLTGKVPLDHPLLRQVFDDRNRIIHEMDMDLSNVMRPRRSRRRDPMIKASNALLKVGIDLLQAVDKRLGKKDV